MGRYYQGDIEGKFWFGIQDSNVGESFGAEEAHPNYVDYIIFKENLEITQLRMKKLEEELGEFKEKIDKFFEEKSGYNDAMLQDEGIDPKYLSPYADWCFGKKILDFFEANPDAEYCEFTAEF